MCSGPLRKQKVMVYDLCLVDFDPFCVILGSLLLKFRVRSRVFEQRSTFTLALSFFYLRYTKPCKFRLFGYSFQIQKKHRYGWVKTKRYVPANIYFLIADFI